MMAQFRVLIFSPEYNVVRRVTLESEDEFTVVDSVMAMMEEKGWVDPEARLVVNEIGI